MFSAQTSQVSDSKLYSDDVFSTYLYTGNSTTQTINNGIDLAGKGGMVWTKGRSNADPAWIMDTNRGVASTLQPHSVNAAGSISTAITAFNSNGFSLGSNGNSNTTNNTYVSWTFRKAPKFFDVVTYTGDGTSGRQINHGLGVKPGMYMVKCTSSSSDWWVWHNSFSNQSSFLLLNRTDSVNTVNGDYVRDASSTTFTIGTGTYINTNGATYVAYLFAHDTSADGIIQCGSFTADASGVIPPTTLGWEPQFILYKDTNGTSNWRMFDTMRAWVAPPSGYANDAELYPNTSTAESLNSAAVDPTSTGLSGNTGFPANRNYIYLAIRRPNKPPTSGTQVYNAIARTGTGAAATVTGVGFAHDLVIVKKAGGADSSYVADRLRGSTYRLQTSATNAEDQLTDAILGFDVTGGMRLGTDAMSGRVNRDPVVYINWFFRRAPGVFDVVCYTGNGATTTRQIAHGLQATPQMIIVKRRDSSSNWLVAFDSASVVGGLYHLNATLDITDASANDYGEVAIGNSWGGSANFSVTGEWSGGNVTAVNASGATYVAYLFGSKAGISKIGTYSGNGGTQTINCGFTTGARFVLIKSVYPAGAWYVWDTARGIVAGNDPHLSLNSAAEEVTTNDSIDPDNTGFIVNQSAATNINVTSATYIYLALA